VVEGHPVHKESCLLGVGDHVVGVLAVGGCRAHALTLPCSTDWHKVCRSNGTEWALGHVWPVKCCAQTLLHAAPAGTFAPAPGLTQTAVFAWEALMTAGLGLTVYGAAVARNAFMGSAPIGIAAAVMAAVMSGEAGKRLGGCGCLASGLDRCLLLQHASCVGADKTDWLPASESELC
jgi:hypothetical protein